MIELWLLFAVGTILCYSTAQQFSKKGVLLLGSYKTGILYSAASVVIQSSYWVLLPDSVPNTIEGILMAILAGVVGALGFVFYIFALRIGKVSVVSVMTAGYPAVSVILAIMILSDRLTMMQGIAIMMIIFAMLLLSGTEERQTRNADGTPKSRLWLFWAIMSLMFWGLWAIPSKLAIGMIGEADYILIDGLTMVVVWGPLWLHFEKGRMERDIHKLKYSAFAGVMASVGTICLFLALSNGIVSLVTPLTSVYPIVTVLLARFTLKERLVWMQYLAVAIAVTGTVLLAL
ncbi:MAG: EamA family transporter [Thermoplasmata archaeon]